MSNKHKSKQQILLMSDNPITSVEEDTLGRLSSADSLVNSILDYDTKNGLVVGLMGPWGIGKSSFINLSRNRFKERSIDIIDFNPWLFSDTDQLAEYFFKEISAQLRLKGGNFKTIASVVEKYSDVLSPLALIPGVSWLDRVLTAFKTSGKFVKSRYDSIENRRLAVTKALQKMDQPLVVVIDDIDRLSTPEIREIFKLVRLTANFPNIIYLLAFDRQRVEQALDESGVSGRAYVEKILQVAYDLPDIPKSVSREQIFQELNKVINNVPESDFDQDRWADVYFEIIEPNITTIRDIKRYALSANITIKTLGSNVDTVDVLALEAIRIFRPNLYAKIKKSVDTLAEETDSWWSDDNKNKAVIDSLISDDNEYARAVIKRIFPAAEKYINNTNYGHGYSNEWCRKARVAHKDNLTTYLEHCPTEGLKVMKMAASAYDLMHDLEGFSKFMSDIDQDELENFIQSLEAYEDEYKKEQVIPASVVLMNNIYRIPERKNRGMFDLSRPDIIVGRVVLRLLRSIEDDERELVAKKILSQLKSYSTRLDFIELIGHREGVGHKLVKKELADQLHSDFIEKVSSQRPTKFANEWQLLRVYYVVVDKKGDKYVPFKFSKVTEIRTLLQDAYDETRSQPMNSRKVKITPVLHWEMLVRVIGSEEAIKNITAKLKKMDGQTDLIILIEKYLEGWRPGQDEDDK
jgi:KAP family P-loop domain protein